MFTLLLILGVVIAVVAFMIGSRAARRPPAPAYQPQPGHGPQHDPRYAAQPPQPGVGGHVMGGLATGLAVGAGAIAAQEIGRRMQDEQGQQGIASGADFHPASDSQLAHDAGIDSFDAGGFDAGGDGGGDS